MSITTGAVLITLAIAAYKLYKVLKPVWRVTK